MGRHKKWRAQAKKMRRKRIRQKLAQERDYVIEKEQEQKENSPRYQAWLSEQKALELFAEEEEARLAAERHAAWLAEEDRAQKAWKERQERLALARAERAKQELRIKEEWEEEQKKIKTAKQEQERLAEEKKQKQEELMRQIENFINKGCDMPPEVNVASVTNPDRPSCPFFTKTGSCRFGDRCSRNHTRPAISRVLLVPNFYDHIGLRQMNPDELEAADDWLEYEDSETYQHFLDFYDDVLPEWERVGRISQFKVCCNFEPHLKGNVYIEYESALDAVRAFKMFHGRFYGGKQINVQFVTIDSWKAAICGQFHKHCCPKGRSCNFLHVFRNPGNAFHAADRDNQEWRRKQCRSQSPSPSRARGRSWSNSPENSDRRRDWRWSASPSPPSERRDSSSRHTSSIRSHHSTSNQSYRKRTSKRMDEYGSDRSRGRSSERSRTKARHSKEDEYRRSRKYRRTTSRKDGASELKDHVGNERTDSHRLSHEDLDKFLKSNSSSNRVNVMAEKPCDINYNLSPRETFVDDGSGQAVGVSNPCENLPTRHNGEGESNSSTPRIKDRKSKKKKKEKDSHRKEKKRKKKSRARSDSSHSSDLQD